MQRGLSARARPDFSPANALRTPRVANDYLDVGSSSIDWLKLVFAAIPVAFLVGLLRSSYAASPSATSSSS
jgi:hypothetical protein